jgi:dihydroorotate dehydrogenase
MTELGALYGLARPLIFALPPEHAHEVTLRTLEAGLYPRLTPDPRLAQSVLGLTFPSPIGIAAGFDKDARVPDAVLGLGCGFAEVGTVTPLPQDGNPRPRVFRLVTARALVNRLGFNNRGHAAALYRLRARRRRGIVGVNVGANKDAVDRVADYVRGIEAFYDVASFFAVNISSPNTPGLRDLQAPQALDELLARVMTARDAQAQSTGRKTPVIVKLAPDVADDDVGAIVEVLQRRQADAIAVSNTTVTRLGVEHDLLAKQAGGLSGAPLFRRSTRLLARIYLETSGRMPLIGIGGIDTPQAALSKFEAGATLIQLYTGLIYEGPALIGRIQNHLCAVLQRERLTGISALTGRKASEWAASELNNS